MAKHRPNMGPTYAQHRPNMPHHRPNKLIKLNMGPTRGPAWPRIAQHCPTWAQHSPTYSQHRPWAQHTPMSPTQAQRRTYILESRRRRTKGSVVGEEWCQNAAPLRWYTKNVFAQSKMILSRAWLHDTVSCAAWNDARNGVYLKPFFKTPCSNCYWGWSIPIMLDYRDNSLMESVPLMWGPVTASPVGIEPMTIFGGGAPPPYNWYPIHNGENSMNCTGWPPNTP